MGQRAVCLLMSAEGASHRAILQATGMRSDAITDTRRRWQQRGMASLRDRPRPGRPVSITPAYRRELHKALRAGPLAYGYLFSVWSVPRLNAHLHSTTGIRLSETWLRHLLHAEGFVYRRPKHTLKGKRNERAFRRAQRVLARLKRGRCAPTPITNSGTRMKPSSTCIRT